MSHNNILMLSWDTVTSNDVTVCHSDVKILVCHKNFWPFYSFSKQLMLRRMGNMEKWYVFVVCVCVCVCVCSAQCDCSVHVQHNMDESFFVVFWLTNTRLATSSLHCTSYPPWARSRRILGTWWRKLWKTWRSTCRFVCRRPGSKTTRCTMMLFPSRRPWKLPKVGWLILIQDRF